MIGVFGGTFDPIHYGHLRSALEVKEIFGLTAVRLIPSAVPPHRHQPKASAAMRLQMLRLAVVNQPDLVVDDRELHREGPSYMVDTLQSLQRDFPHQTLLLFMGSDAFNHLTTWHCWQELFAYAHIVVLTRPGFQPQWQGQDHFFIEKLIADQHLLTHSKAGKLFFQAITQLDISATAIRGLIARQKNPQFLLPDVVIDYIRQHQLYQEQ